MAAGWNLRLKRPLEQPFIGKFPSKINFQETSHEVCMYLQSEDIREEYDDEGDVVKDANYYKAKKKTLKRRKYNKTSKLILEDTNKPAAHAQSTDPAIIGRYEGQLVDLSLEDSLNAPSTFSNDSNGEMFRYALLEVVAGSESKATEVNVIPIYNMFNFRRPALTGDMLLDEVDDAYDEKMRKDKLKMQRYRRIGKALEEWERKDIGEADDNSNETEASKPATGAFVIPDLFGSQSKKSKPRGGVRKPISSGLADDDHMRELDGEYRGDYSAKFVDDEEDNVVAEQNYLNSMEDRFNAERETVDVTGAGDDEEDEEEEDEEDGTEVPPPGVVVTVASESVGGINIEEFNIVARDARDILINKNPLNKKRAHDESAGSTSAQSPKAKRVTIEESGLSFKSEIRSEAPTSKDSSEFEFSEAGLRAYIMSMGGRVTTNDMKEAFKSQLKRETKRLGDKSAAQNQFLSIIRSVTKKDSDGMFVLADKL